MMAYVFVRRRSDADRIATVMLRGTGYLPTIFRDGRGYRVQSDALGEDALLGLLRQAGLQRLAQELGGEVPQ